MLISYHWLSEFLKITLPPRELADRLTGAGLAVEGIHTANNDFILDFDLTSNRPDCLSHLGIAREVAVIEQQELFIRNAPVFDISGKTSDNIAVQIDDPELCPRYTARIVRGVKIGPSPHWLRQRLESIGQRPINNVADITNYVLHELGQPLHAFDLAKLKDQQIVVRRARAGEKLRTLDGVDRPLDTEMLVIADSERPVALAGIMGGEESEISNSTVDVLIESAHFQPASVRVTSRRLGLRTEASSRFERGVDPEGVIRAQERCVSLICEIASGTATIDTLDLYPNPSPSRNAFIRRERVAALTGVAVLDEEIERILTALGFALLDRRIGADTEVEFNGDLLEEIHYHSRESFLFRAPTWRFDIEREEDLIEEVVRHAGFDRIQAALPPTSLAGEYQPSERRRREVRNSLRSLGFDEAINFSFIDSSNDDRFKLLPALSVARSNVEPFVTLQNPILEGVSRMRPTLLPGLLHSLRHNLNRGNRNVSLFEIGNVFAGGETPGSLPREHESLALLGTGGALLEDQAAIQRDLNFFDLKGAVESACSAMRLAGLNFRPASVLHLREGQSAAIFVGEQEVGTIGRLADSVAAEHKFRQPVFVAELDLTILLDLPETPVRYSPVARYPSVVRDSSFVVSRSTTFDHVMQAIATNAPELCRNAVFVAVYEGANLPQGRKSVTLRFEYRADDRTLTDDEVDALHEELVGKLRTILDADLRE